MTYGDLIRHNPKLDDCNNTLDALRVIYIRDVLHSVNLTNEQKKKFLDKETDSLDNFNEDFEHFLATEI